MEEFIVTAYRQGEIARLLLVAWLFAPYLTYVAWCLTGNGDFLAPTSLPVTVAIGASLAGSVFVFSIGLWREIVNRDVFSIALMCLFTCYVAVMMLIALLSPLSSWDALGGEWGVHSFAELAVRISSPEFGGDRPRAPRHPPLVPYMLAAGEASNYFSAHPDSGVALVWLSFLLAPIALLYATARTTISARSGVFFSMVLVSTPLLENHVGLFGYYEIFVWSLLQSVALLLLFRILHEDETCYITLLTALLVSAALVLTKSIAALYLAVVWMAYVASHLKVHVTFLLALAVIAAVLLLNNILQSTGGGNYSVPSISFFGEDTQVAFSHRLTDLHLEHIGEAMRSIFLALFANTSFSIMASFLVTVSIFIFGDLPRSKASRFIILAALGVFVAFVVVGSSSYLSDNGAWGRDTLLSRSLLPAAFLLPIYLYYLSHTLRDKS